MSPDEENNCYFCGLLTSCKVDDEPVCSSCEIEHVGGMTFDECKELHNEQE